MATDAAPTNAPRGAACIQDFDLVRRLGDGSFSTVALARHKRTGQEVALKIVDKKYVIRHKAVGYVQTERALLDRLAHPGFVRLLFTFQDAASLYLALEVCPHGELYNQIRERGRLPEPAARQYAAEVVLMLRALRAEHIVHRDLKPENLLLDAEGHLKLIDFGSAKQLPPEQAVPPPPGAAERPEQQLEAPDGSGKDGNGAAETRAPGESSACQEGRRPASPGGKRATSLVGTAEYVAPEVLEGDRPLSCAADLWALGCVLYQMLVGRPPFRAGSEWATLQRIIAVDYPLARPSPASSAEAGAAAAAEDAQLSEAAADLIQRLLQREPAARIGAQDLAELQAHPFFEGIDWAAVRQQPAPQWVPTVAGSGSSSAGSFDWELQSLAAALPPSRSADPDADVFAAPGCERPSFDGER